MNEMTVASVMTTDVVTTVPDTPFRELVAVMSENEVSAVPVVDHEGRPIGVVSEADLLAKQEFHGGQDKLPSGDRAGRNRWYRAMARNAAEVMTTPVRAVHADEPVSLVARLLAKAGIRRLFVIDRNGRLAGMPSKRRCGPGSSRRKGSVMWEPSVDSVMTKKVVIARPETKFKELVTLMNTHRVSGLPVLDRAGRPVGVVSEADTLVKQEHLVSGETKPWFGRRRRERWRRATGCTAGDLMTAPAVTVGTDTTITAAARLLAEKNIRRLCVVDADGVLAGIVSRRDVIGTFLRADVEIQADIEERVFRKGMWLFPGSLVVVVADGVVTLDGSVERRTTSQIAGQLTHAIPGVVAVHNNVRYELDDTVTSPL